jgi:hypothetical protein
MYSKPEDIYGHWDMFRLWSTGDPRHFIQTSPGTNWPLHSNCIVAISDTQEGIDKAHRLAVLGRL